MITYHDYSCFFKIISDNPFLSDVLAEIAQLKNKLVSAVRSKDFIKAGEIKVKIDKLEEEAKNLKNEGETILESDYLTSLSKYYQILLE